MKGPFVVISCAVLILATVGFWAYVRLAPSDPARWHIDPMVNNIWPQDSSNELVTLTSGALLRLPAAEGLLARLDAVAMATPRTTRLAGSVAEGRITWVTRSRIWGFPDYTTAQAGPDGLYIYARQRFGKADLGVNAARLRDWQSKL